MEPIVIFEHDTEIDEFEAENKGYRGDVIVEIGAKRYKVYVISMIRLQQDFDSETKDSGFYYTDPNTILTETTTREEIERTINRLWRCKYFERLDRFGF